MVDTADTHSPDGECRRCGACCEKGGPALHREDRSLIESGRVPLKYLFTIRPGETVRENVKGGLFRTETDVIKIKGQKGKWCCVFLDGAEKTCTIYEDRPLECRALNCQKPQALESIYARDRLTRKDLLFSIRDLWDLVEDHERRCSHALVLNLLNSETNRPNSDAQTRLASILNYDMQIRRLIVEKGKMDPGILDFLFGRPLTAIAATR